MRRLVFEYGSSPPISLDLCADDEDPSQLIIRPGWDAPHVRCFPRMFSAWPCLLRQVGAVLGSPYDYVLTGLAYANPGSRHDDMPLISFVYHCQSFIISHEQSVKEGMFVVLYFMSWAHSCHFILVL